MKTSKLIKHNVCEYHSSGGLALDELAPNDPDMRRLPARACDEDNKNNAAKF